MTRAFVPDRKKPHTKRQTIEHGVLESGKNRASLPCLNDSVAEGQATNGEIAERLILGTRSSCLGYGDHRLAILAVLERQPRSSLQADESVIVVRNHEPG